MVDGWRSRTATLPVRDVLAEVGRSLSRGTSAVLVAPPGAGKTTVVPLALLEEPWLEGRKILMLEPRRLAARAAATRMADLLGEADAGGTVGYRMRLESRVSTATRIEVVTEGILTRMLQSDPSLRGHGLVIFDEFHERSLQADVGLALTLHARGLLCPELRVLVMSATLDAELVAQLLGGAAVIRSEGRIHPVETRWLERAATGWIEPVVADRVREALANQAGDVLAFLPGAAEIRRTGEALRGTLPADTDVYELFGMLPREVQDRALRGSPQGRRKVVLSSAIAESSLTIDGVRVVVDSGLMRVPRFDPGTGMTRLATVRVTRDAADQRRGRAGRTAPGVCYRLWTRTDDQGLVPTRVAEIREADLAPLVLDLAAFGADAGELPWLDAPAPAALAQARELLGELEALDSRGVLTEHGRRMSEVGIHPRLAHLVLRGVERGAGGLACDLAALLEERDILRGVGRAPDVDLRLRVEALRRPGRVETGGLTVEQGVLSRVRQQADALRRRVGVGAGPRGAAGDLDAVGLLAALAYPDRVGQLRPGARGRFVLRNGRGVALDPSDSLAGEPWIVAATLDAGGSEGRVFQAAALTREELEGAFAHQVESLQEVVWDDGAGRVQARAVRRLGALTLTEGAQRDPDPQSVGTALCAGVRARGLHVLPWDRDSTQLRERFAFLRALEGERWPDPSEAALLASLEVWLAPFLAGKRSLDDLARVDVGKSLVSVLPWGQRADLERLAPTHVEVPSGSRILLDYSDPGAPVLAVRLQEVFGLLETPTVGGGRVPLTVRLLSPAHRPVQVTRDLASFWKSAYFEVRKDLRARYPKHHWPENPVAAEPTRRARPRKHRPDG
ncbi:MAG: ATP-dependent helicase HrpB [Longimicrobiales bacterium]|nr:ATP-dependent helicase HrpB [Longimicrobiales bacterium]